MIFIMNVALYSFFMVANMYFLVDFFNLTYRLFISFTKFALIDWRFWIISSIQKAFFWNCILNLNLFHLMKTNQSKKKPNTSFRIMLLHSLFVNLIDLLFLVNIHVLTQFTIVFICLKIQLELKLLICYLDCQCRLSSFCYFKNGF